MRSVVLSVLALLLPVVATAQISTAPPKGPGQPCEPGQFAFAGALLACGDDARFRAALPEDIPPAPEGGYQQRPDWFPRLGDMLLEPANAPTCPVIGRVTFTSPVIAIEDLLTIVPQGMMVADHVTPIDHAYLGVRSLAIPRDRRTESDYLPVRVPADGVVTSISTLSPNSIRVVMAHGCETYSIYIVLNRLSGVLSHLQDDLLAKGYLSTNVKVTAGDIFGMQRDNPLDFSVHVGTSWLSGLAAPFSYTSAETWKPFTVDPWPYFSSDLGTAYQDRMQRVAAPRFGRIDIDQAGTAAGNWFIDGTLGYSGFPIERIRNGEFPQSGPIEGKNSYAWGHLSIAPHWVQPSWWIFSTGWWIDSRGDATQMLMEIADGQPAPSQLHADGHMEVYRLSQIATDYQMAPGDESPLPINYKVIGGMPLGSVAVALNADGTLSIETFPGVNDPSRVTGFTSARRTYRR